MQVEQNFTTGTFEVDTSLWASTTACANIFFFFFKVMINIYLTTLVGETPKPALLNNWNYWHTVMKLPVLRCSGWQVIRLLKQGTIRMASPSLASIKKPGCMIPFHTPHLPNNHQFYSHWTTDFSCTTQTQKCLSSGCMILFQPPTPH